MVVAHVIASTHVAAVSTMFLAWLSLVDHWNNHGNTVADELPRSPQYAVKEMPSPSGKGLVSSIMEVREGSPEIRAPSSSWRKAHGSLTTEKP